jgi:hypothetical protein
MTERRETPTTPENHQTRWFATQQQKMHPKSYAALIHCLLSYSTP